MKRRIVNFRKEDAKDLVMYLKNNKLTFEEGNILSTVCVNEDSEHWDFIDKQISKRDLFYTTEMFFSPEELSEAKWLSVYSERRVGYPQPEKNFGYQEITYNSDSYCDHCGAGLIQQDDFRIKKAPSWGKYDFMELNWIGDELFVSDKAKQVLLENEIEGISFRTVKNSKGLENLAGISQLIIEEGLGSALIHFQEGIKQEEVCKKCGITKYTLSGEATLKYRRTAFPHGPDFVKSKEIFGSGQYAAKQVLISQKAYRVLILNKLDKGLVFEPINLVD